jgi:hypothetical protein
MHRARRLASVAVAAVLGLAGLAACRSEPGVAVYLGDQRITEDRVNAIARGAEPPAATQQAQPQEQQQEQQQPEPTPSGRAQPAVSRQDVVDLLVSLDLGKQIVAEQDLQVADQVSPEQVAAELQIAPGSEYARMYGEWIDVAQAIMAAARPGTPTDEQTLAVYAGLVEAGAIEPDLSLAQVKEAFGDGQFVSVASALGDQLADRADADDTTVNPRYLPLAAPLFVTANGRPVFYALPYVEGSGAVTDAA